MSAFEFYSKKKKSEKPISGPIASTPLPETSIFKGLPVEASVSNVFLESSIESAAQLSKRQLKKLRKKASQEEDKSPEHPTSPQENLSNGLPKIVRKDKHGSQEPENTSDGPISPTISLDRESKAGNKKRKKNINGELISKNAILPKEKKSVVMKNGFEVRDALDSQGSDAGIFASNTLTLCEKKKKKKKDPSSPVGNVPEKSGKRKADDNASECLAKKFKPSASEKIRKENSLLKGQSMLAWIISPVTIEDFFENYWEKKPLHIPRNDPKYYDGICSMNDLDEAMRKSPVNFLKNVTVTAYKDGERITEQTPGRARPNAVWDLFNSGHSIRLLNPQTFVPNVGSVVATLQEYFRCMVGVNSYLTPAGTQGFAPHYDDIEAFVIQTEGKKEWKVYPPLEYEELPQFSSRDFSQEEIGEPMMEVTLEAGDLLYFPRGWIHQAKSVKDQHSLHLTVSTYQRNTWGDFFKSVLPAALDDAIANDIEFRMGLPLDLIDQLRFGAECSPELLGKMSRLFGKLADYCSWRDAADQFGKEFIHSSFPPKHEDLPEQVWRDLNEHPLNASVRLITANAIRVCNEPDEKTVCYYSTDNSIEPKGEELMGFEISPEEAEIIRCLRDAYPKYTKTSQLASLGHSEEDIGELMNALGQRALLDVQINKA